MQDNLSGVEVNEDFLIFVSPVLFFTGGKYIYISFSVHAWYPQCLETFIGEGETLVPPYKVNAAEFLGQKFI